MDAVLKSTPPTRAGTENIKFEKETVKLKSTPPTRAGTSLPQTVRIYDSGLNPPRPHGRGLQDPEANAIVFRLKSTPPTRAGTEYETLAVKDTKA